MKDKKLNKKTHTNTTDSTFILLKTYACNEGCTVHLYSKMC